MAKTAVPAAGISGEEGRALPLRRHTGDWYVVAVRPHAEWMARAHLERQEFTVFSPMIEHTVRHARQFITREAPLFAGYLFVRLDLDKDPWRAINGTRGVRALLMSGDRPARVPAPVMQEILCLGAEPPELAPGAELKILAGPFAGLAARLLRLDGKARVTVLLQLIGAERAMSLPLAAVRPVD